MLVAFENESKDGKVVNYLPSVLLTKFIQNLQNTNTEPPRKRSGLLNRLVIAKKCGFSRHHLYHNQDVVMMLKNLELKV